MPHPESAVSNEASFGNATKELPSPKASLEAHVPQPPNPQHVNKIVKKKSVFSSKSPKNAQGNPVKFIDHENYGPALNPTTTQRILTVEIVGKLTGQGKTAGGSPTRI